MLTSSTATFDPFAGETLHDTLLQAVRFVAAQAAALREAAGGSLTDHLATCLTATLSASWMQPSEVPNPTLNQNLNLNHNHNRNPNPPTPTPIPAPDSPPTPPSTDSTPPANPQLDNLNPPLAAPKPSAGGTQIISHLLVLLRRGDHYVEWLKIQRQHLEFDIQKHQEKLAALKAKTEPDRSRVRPDGGPTKEFIEQLKKDLRLFA